MYAMSITKSVGYILLILKSRQGISKMTAHVFVQTALKRSSPYLLLICVNSALIRG
jgi:hypothetical protein